VDFYGIDKFFILKGEHKETVIFLFKYANNFLVSFWILDPKRPLMLVENAILDTDFDLSQGPLKEQTSADIDDIRTIAYK
jgi:hypothetical protein